VKILFADDDRDLVDLLRYAFKRDGHNPITAFDGEAALRLIQSEAPDIVVLDVNMPKRSGLDVLQELRQYSQVPVLMLTAVGDEDHLVAAFKLGADDYLVKPFRPRELSVRVEALQRRSKPTTRGRDVPRQALNCGEITLDTHSREVLIAGQPVKLTRNEYALLHYLMLNKGIIVNVSDILVNVWGYDAEESEDIVKVTISRLRHKIEPDPSHPRYIKTMHGVGYSIQDRP
jgi:DNA-binding response OmpR family regulator